MYDAYARIFTRLGLEVPRGRRGHRPDRRHAHRTSSRCWPTRARTPSPGARVPTTPPTSSWPRRSRPHAHRAAPAEPMQKVPTPGMSTCEEVRRAAASAARRARSNASCCTPEARCTCCSLRGDHTPERGQGRQSSTGSRDFAGPATPRSRPPPAANPAISDRSESLPTCR